MASPPRRKITSGAASINSLFPRPPPPLLLTPSCSFLPLPPSISAERRKLVFNYSCSHPVAPRLPLLPLFLTRLTALPPSGPDPFPALVAESQPELRQPALLVVPSVTSAALTNGEFMERQSGISLPRVLTKNRGRMLVCRSVCRALDCGLD